MQFRFIFKKSIILILKQEMKFLNTLLFFFLEFICSLS